MRLSLIVLLLACLLGATNVKAQSPKRVILFMIDGLHWQAPDKFHMPNFNALAKQGTYIQESYVLMPHHPTIGDYSEFNSCSFPNPVLHGGTVFLSPDNTLLQESLPIDFSTAFVVNTQAYRSVARGFSTTVMDGSLSDAQVVDTAINVLDAQQPNFMRIHLQSPGELGRSVSNVSPSKPYFRDIFGSGSPYQAGIEQADKLLGKFVQHLKSTGQWDETVLIVTSDHGQAIVGWHPMFDQDSWKTPIVFAGKGIAQGRSLSYFEQTDLAPTIRAILGADAVANNGGDGQVVKQVFASESARAHKPKQYLKTLNQQIKQFNLYKSRLLLEAEQKPHLAVILAALENTNLTPEPFYHQDRITQWHMAGTVEHMIDANQKILDQMIKALEE